MKYLSITIFLLLLITGCAGTAHIIKTKDPSMLASYDDLLQKSAANENANIDNATVRWSGEIVDVGVSNSHIYLKLALTEDKQFIRPPLSNAESTIVHIAAPISASVKEIDYSYFNNVKLITVLGQPQQATINKQETFVINPSAIYFWEDLRNAQYDPAGLIALSQQKGSPSNKDNTVISPYGRRNIGGIAEDTRPQFKQKPTSERPKLLVF